MAQDTITLTADSRDISGKAVKQLRKDGKIPAVIHDHGKESIMIQADSVALTKVWRQAGKHHPVQLTAGGKKYVALIKDASLDPKKNTVTHVVFNAVDRNQTVDAEVPIRPRYDEGNESSPAERNSLIVLAQLDVVAVKALATNLPDALEYDAEKLVNVGDHVTIADLIVPEGVEIEAEAEHTIATVFEPSALAAANDAAGGDAEAGDEQLVETDQQPEDIVEDESRDELNPGGRKGYEDNDQGRNPEKH